jgi:site-specific DNA recombinase
MALNPVYIGTWVYGKHGRRATPEQPVGIPVPVPALIGRDDWDEIGRAFAHRNFARRSNRPIEEDPWLLRGRLTCGHCHGAIQSVNNHGVRYYRCARHCPSIARHARKPVCTMRDVFAPALEAELQRILTATVLDEEHLGRGLAAAREQHDRADAIRNDRLSAIDAEIARHRKRLEAMVDELIDAGPAAKEAIRKRIDESETLIARLDRERAELAAVRTEGLSGEEADAIQTFAAHVREGLADFTPADWRRLYEVLRIRGTLYLDPEDVRLGRYHAFRIEWDGAIRLLQSLNRNL